MGDNRCIELMGVKVHLVTARELNEEVGRVVGDAGKALILNVNTHCMNLAHARPWMKRLLNSAHLVFCDGFGVVLAARIAGRPAPVRITLADWIWGFCEYAQQRALRLFFLGARPGVAEKAAERLHAAFPRLRICGTYHGYFDKRKNSAENRAVVRRINDARPNVLFVGFGMPLQERWLMENWGAIHANVGMSVGAMFDYVSGTLPRGPRWMTDNGLEWLARLLIQPRHLWRRYLIGNPLFLCRAFREALSTLAQGPR